MDRYVHRCINKWMDTKIYGYMDRYVNEWTATCMNEYIHRCMEEWIDGKLR